MFWNNFTDILTNSRTTEIDRRKSFGGAQIHEKPKGCKSFFRFPKRFFFVLFFVITNLVYAAFTCYEKFQDSRTTISHVLLVILTGNLTIYLFYYTMRTWYAALTHRKSKPVQKVSNENEGIQQHYILRIINCNLILYCQWQFIYPYKVDLQCFTDQCCDYRICGRFAHAGVFFSLLSMVSAGFGLYFYLNRSANRNASPAESQNLNVECSFLDFFDYVSTFYSLMIKSRMYFFN